MSFRSEIIKHLSDYKIQHIGLLEKGLWERQGKTYEFDHILPRKTETVRLNILQDYREFFYCSALSNISYHRFFHHLNSSQAMCINFFFPLFWEKRLELVLIALGLNNDLVDYKTVCFEKESNIETIGRPTSFDFYFQTTNGKKIHFEIKYTEYDFSKIKIDDKVHIEKYNKDYSSKCASIKQEFCNVDRFLENYQLMRNLIHVSKDSYVVFLHPTDNKRISKEAKFARTDLIKGELQQNVIDLTWEKLLDSIDKGIKDSDNLISQMNEFKEKYRIKPSR